MIKERTLTPSLQCSAIQAWVASELLPIGDLKSAGRSFTASEPVAEGSFIVRRTSSLIFLRTPSKPLTA